MSTLRFYGQFTKGGAGAAPSVAPLANVYRITRSDNTVTQTVTDAAVTASIAHGAYFYTLTGADLTAYEYFVFLSTTDTTVDLQQIPALQQILANADTLTTYAGNTPQSGDAFASAATLLARLTSTRAAYLDNLSAGAVATAAAVANISNNTFVSTDIPPVLERPDSGSELVRITVVFNDETGSPADIDASGLPAVVLVNNAGTDRSARVSAWAHPAAGKYTATYTNSAADAIENLHWEITGTVNSKLRRQVVTMQVVDTTAVDFTTADRAKLDAVAAVAPANTPAVAIDGSVTVGTVMDKDGYALRQGGLDAVTVEPAAGVVPNVNARQALALCVDVLVAVLSGAGPGGGVITIRNLGNTVDRLKTQVDTNGNRLAINTFNPPA